MTVEDVREKLVKESLVKPEKGWTPLDTQGEETFGLNISKIKEIAKQLPKDPALADELYAGRNHDLKVLATYIDDSESYTKDDLQKRAEQLYPSPFAEKFCQNVLAKSDFAVHFIDSWSNCEVGDYKCYAYYTLAELAKQKNKLSDDFYANYLKTISDKMEQSTETVRDAMAAALKSIGSRDPKLLKKCEEIARGLSEIKFKSGIQHAQSDVLVQAQVV